MQPCRLPDGKRGQSDAERLAQFDACLSAGYIPESQCNRRKGGGSWSVVCGRLDEGTSPFLLLDRCWLAGLRAAVCGSASLRGSLLGCCSSTPLAVELQHSQGNLLEAQKRLDCLKGDHRCGLLMHLRKVKRTTATAAQPLEARQLLTGQTCSHPQLSAFLSPSMCLPPLTFVTFRGARSPKSSIRCQPLAFLQPSVCWPPSVCWVVPSCSPSY